MDDSATPVPAGFEESMSDFDRLSRIKLLDDATLLHDFQALSNARVIMDSDLLGLLAREVRARGLLREH